MDKLETHNPNEPQYTQYAQTLPKLTSHEQITIINQWRQRFTADARQSIAAAMVRLNKR